MGSSLKGRNTAKLLALAAANLAVFYGVIEQHLPGQPVDLVRKLGGLVPAGVGLTLIGILNAQLSAEGKARVVFLRWRDPLPGSEAFTKHGAMDPRVDLAVLGNSFGPLPTAAHEQNALWYRLYKSVELDPSVVPVHRAFLFTRDYACLALFAWVALSVMAFVQGAPIRTALVYCLALGIQFLLAMRAAQTHGVRFVTTVLAITSAQRARAGGSPQ